MQCLDINGKPCRLILPAVNLFRPRSDLHLQVRQFLHTHFPVNKIFEEVNIPGSKYFLDFFVPQQRLACEAHGEQHYRYIPYFHSLPSGFTASRHRDNIKLEWCQQNGIRLAIFPFDTTPTDWKEIIDNSINYQ
jgi:hypothetical protein